jgi:4-amino-4-deoxy-L-arabinose transferase-like glycosyltransferase
MSALPGSRRKIAALVALGLLALLLRVVGLGAQPLSRDDVAVAATAHNFATEGWPEPTMWNHPRLRDLLVHSSLGALGAGPWGIKAWSVLLGAATAPATAMLVSAASGSTPAALLAGALVATDPLHVDFSRQGINDVYLGFFPVAAAVALLWYRERRRTGALAAAGVLLGLGIASKWGAAFPVAAVAFACLAPALRTAPSARDRAAEALRIGAALVLLPLTVYLVTWWPWFGRGHGLAELLRFHLSMARETVTHTGYPGTKLPGFPGEVVGAGRWFVQPIWYVDWIRPGRPGLPPEGLFLAGVANPAVWLATLPAAAWAVARRIRDRDATAGLLALALAGAYLPFLLAGRPIWTNSAVGVLPFSAAVVGWAAARLHERWRVPVRAWVVAAALLAAALWPPAVARSSATSDAVLRTLVSPLAFAPENHPAS